jgi:hypothetical protein
VLVGVLLHLLHQCINILVGITALLAQELGKPVKDSNRGVGYWYHCQGHVIWAGGWYVAGG